MLPPCRISACHLAAREDLRTPVLTFISTYFMRVADSLPCHTILPWCCCLFTARRDSPAPHNTRRTRGVLLRFLPTAVRRNGLLVYRTWSPLLPGQFSAALLPSSVLRRVWTRAQDCWPARTSQPLGFAPFWDERCGYVRRVSWRSRARRQVLWRYGLDGGGCWRMVSACYHYNLSPSPSLYRSNYTLCTGPFIVTFWLSFALWDHLSVEAQAILLFVRVQTCGTAPLNGVRPATTLAY